MYEFLEKDNIGTLLVTDYFNQKVTVSLKKSQEHQFRVSFTAITGAIIDLGVINSVWDKHITVLTQKYGEVRSLYRDKLLPGDIIFIVDYPFAEDENIKWFAIKDLKRDGDLILKVNLDEVEKLDLVKRVSVDLFSGKIS